MFDPPSGWMYGFPVKLKTVSDFVDWEKEIPSKEKLAELLKEHGYPEKDIPFALKHSRYYTQ